MGKKSVKIKTNYGEKTLVRRVGTQGEYAFTLPTPSAPHGEWWVFNLQRGWIPCPSNSRALQTALENQD